MAVLDHVDVPDDAVQLQFLLISNKGVDVDALRRDFDVSRAPLHKVRVASLLLTVYEKAGNDAGASEMRDFLRSDGGTTASAQRFVDADR